MTTNRKKERKIKFLILSLIFISGCCTKLSDSYYWTEYKVINLRIDDDAEYHITYQSGSGIIYSEHDLDNYDITTSRGSVPYPIFRKRNNKHCDCFGNMSYSEGNGFQNTRQLIIPNDYKIETFDD